MAKKSRRARRQEAEKQRKTTSEILVPTLEEQPAPAFVATRVTPVEQSETPIVNRKLANFAQEYFYVYADLRNIFVFAVLMIAVLIGLSFVI